MNPYAPPAPVEANTNLRTRHPLALLMIGLGFSHFVSAASDLPYHVSLLSMGTASPLPALPGLIACLLFYAATFTVLGNPARARTLYLCAAIGFGLAAGAAAALGTLPLFGTLLITGTVEVVLGFWLAFRMQKQREKAA
jgi:hypothetical protein